MSSWFSFFFSSDYCLLLAVAEGTARVACIAHLVTVSMNQAKCCKCIIKHSVNALFIDSLCEMGYWKTQRHFLRKNWTGSACTSVATHSLCTILRRFTLMLHTILLIPLFLINFETVF